MGSSKGRCGRHVVDSNFGSLRLDPHKPAGVSVFVTITTPDEVIESYMSGDRTLDWQTRHLLELNDICELNGWDLQATRYSG